eukprot:3343958-Pleurochrysis_carterae.AAC.7
MHKTRCWAQPQTKTERLTLLSCARFSRANRHCPVQSASRMLLHLLKTTVMLGSGLCSGLEQSKVEAAEGLVVLERARERLRAGVADPEETRSVCAAIIHG